MQKINFTTSEEQQSVKDLMQQACKKIAPLWPLENFVAVNPYLGFTDQKFEDAAKYFSSVGGVQMTLPTTFYTEKYKEGKIKKEDLREVLSQKNQSQDVEQFIQDLETAATAEPLVKTLSDAASEHSHKDWSHFVVNRISVWAASYFDRGQSIWNTSKQNAGIFEAWLAEAKIDRSPEIAGLKYFRDYVKDLPAEPYDAVLQSLDMLQIPEEKQALYFHRLLMKSIGWASYIAQLDWDDKLAGTESTRLESFLSVLVCWEAGLMACLDSPALDASWHEALQAYDYWEGAAAANKKLSQDLILQEAFNKSVQKEIIEKFKHNTSEKSPVLTSKKAQAIFCIDVRSEILRRHLEQADDEIETLGFAGFFAFPVNFLPLAHDHGEAQCPVLIPTGPAIQEQLPDHAENGIAQKRRIFRHQVKQLWKQLRAGAISCFSFVSPMGLSYMVKLFTDSYGLSRPVPHPQKAGLSTKEFKKLGISLDQGQAAGQITGISPEQRLAMAKNALKAMSLTENFARFVCIVGHGSTSVNNPHATGLDCGACGGHSGEANAKVAAAVLNDKEVRAKLQNDQIFIPESTVFLACLHDTSTDTIQVFETVSLNPEQEKEFQELKKSFEKAGKASRAERALRMEISNNTESAIFKRANDWSQIRPEWGLAGCTTFVVAPRKRTQNIDLKGSSFLHSYEWQSDQGFKVLELIMTAPMVVTSWINLQYFASTVDNKIFGAGNKTLHNVTAGLGVLEGFSGDLRVGLPMQSVHDGKSYQHEPVKLNVIIEAPIEAMNAILEKHPTVKDLCDNEWINLLAMDTMGQVSHRYVGQYQWTEL